MIFFLPDFHVFYCRTCVTKGSMDLVLCKKLDILCELAVYPAEEIATTLERDDVRASMITKRHIERT